MPNRHASRGRVYASITSAARPGRSGLSTRTRPVRTTTGPVVTDCSVGGATSTGVTADSIKVVVYLPQANDPILSFIYRQIGNNDTPDDVFATYEPVSYTHLTLPTTYSV